MRKNVGCFVETKTGMKGKTYYHEGLVNKKTVVHVEENGKTIKYLCSPKTLTITGYFDGENEDGRTDT